MHEWHHALILDQPSLRQDRPHAHVVHRVLSLRIRLPDRLHADLLPLREPRRHVHPDALGRLGVERRAVGFALFSLLELLEQGRLRVADRLERAAHVCAGFDEGAVGCASWVGPACELNRLRLVQELGPHVLGGVGGKGGHEQGRGADPVLDEIDVHTDVSGDLAVPVTDVLQLVKAILQCVLERRAKSEQMRPGGLERRERWTYLSKWCLVMLMCSTISSSNTRSW